MGLKLFPANNGLSYNSVRTDFAGKMLLFEVHLCSKQNKTEN